MAVRKILKWPSAKLRLKSKPIADFDFAKTLAQDCFDTMKANLGVGVAAPQIGFNSRLLVVDSSHLPSLEPCGTIEGACVIINPVLSPVTDETFKWEEACLSVDDIQATVERHLSINLEYENLDRERLQVEITGPESGVIQHEADHLEGRLFIDRLPIFERRRVLKKLKRKNAEKLRERKERNKKRLAEAKKTKIRQSRKKVKKTFGKNKRRK